MAVAVEELSAADRLQIARESEEPVPLGSVRRNRLGPGSRGGQVRKPAGSSPAGKVAGAASSAVKQLPTGGQPGIGGMFVRLIWAVALGLIVLEVLSQLTGRYFTWDLATGWANLKQAGSYVGLYPGQPSAGAAGPSTSAVPPPPPRDVPVPGIYARGPRPS